METNPDILTPQRRTTPENVAKIKESVGAIAQAERAHLHEVYERGKERVKGAELRFEDYVRHNPLRSILIAVGTGAALGFLFGRRR